MEYRSRQDFKILHPANITKYVLLQFRQYVEHFLMCDVRILIFDGWLTKMVHMFRGGEKHVTKIPRSPAERCLKERYY